MSEPKGLREAAIEWLKMRSLDGQIPLTREDIGDFRWNGEPFPLISTQNGIRKPAGFDAALSFYTVYRPKGHARPYEDEIGDDGLMRYKWQGTDPRLSANQGLFRAHERGLPLIWFVGVGMSPARFQVVAPVYVVGREDERHQIVFAPMEPEDYSPELMQESVLEASLKRYLRREVKIRVHQPHFRSTVLAAYDNHCAVCNFAHPELLDAAHIVPDREVHGLPTVVNGLAMCRIHHGAFDNHFLGITPDFTVEIRQDLLDEVDGPMLRHGLQDLHGRKLMKLPTRRADRPSRENLAWAYERFREATVADVA
ncbi:HNH endonuclease [Micrococcus luteus]|uniref:HNH endonuclease n=1 Tax=Micrococcus luteus TaxID=1270 RepID=UPI00387A4BAD